MSEKQAEGMQEVMEAVKATRESFEKMEAKSAKGEAGLSEIKVKMEKAEKALEDFDKKSNDAMLETKKKENEALEMAEKIKELEIKAAQFGSAAVNPKDARAGKLAMEEKAFQMWATGKDTKMSDMERKNYLRTDDNVQGGFLVQSAYDDFIIKPITETDPMRSLARTKRIDANELTQFARATLVTTYWTGEGEEFTDSTSTYAQPQIAVHSITSKTPITNRELLASTFNMDNEIMSDFRESRLQKESASFVTGNGSHKPRGFTDSTAAVPTFNGSGSSTFTYDDTIDITGELKDGYDPMYGFNRKTLAHMRKLKDGGGAYIWREGNLGAGVPNAINGEPYVILPSMPDIATDATPLAYCDFRRMYTIVDSWNAIMLRNPYKFDGKVQFSIEAWVGGDVSLAEAGQLLKTIA